MTAEQVATGPQSQCGGEQSDGPGSVYALLKAQAARYPENDLLVLPQAVRTLWGLDEPALSYGGTLHRVDALADRYRAAGYGPGHRVALLLENRPAHFLHWLALNSIGASVVPVNPDYTADELHFLLEHSDSTLLVHLPSRAAQASEGAEGLPVSLVPEDAATFPSAATPAGSAPADPTAAECALIYTSGTTGRPKGCILTNGYFHGWAEWYCAQRGHISLREGVERLMTPLPTFHVNAMGNSFMGMLASGGAQIIVDRFHPRSWWDMARETGATCFHYLGVMPAILLAIPPADTDRDHSLRFGMGGGVHPDHHAAFEARFGVPLLEGWAMTETGGAGILCASEEPRHVGERCLGRADRPGPPMEIRLLDDEGRDALPGEPGELVLRARGADPTRRFFSGYLKNEAATREIWAGGWLRTGDVMRRGADGALHFVDRKKNIIRRSGENIAAVEVEGAIASHPGVSQVAVIAVLDPLRGEEVLAVVVPKEGKGDAALADAVFAHCADRLAYYKLPGYVAFRPSLPTTSTQKVRKTDLGDLASAPDKADDCHDLRERKQTMRKAAP
ncbi:AMP-binding protein [Amorphus orientalis]|uniref:Acyl-CoA synthetase (AMP-forming)/AMP-acid ligase II n=1 Tax=Amorphus orientalis TaxID=649198 RepID=A0AAE3VPK2_9HYPH|nr:AMP-binding protein [Amorphus orientalis]MDQ0315445.1 acyl-CoA synthetase (AMP-forming)/AMP-acid ligase II [Amorphus orientalis]